MRRLVFRGEEEQASMEVCSARDLHDVRTQLHELIYCFTPKHHRGEPSDDAQWALPRPAEFAVFDMADFHQFRDEDRNLYGMHLEEPREGHRLLELGTKHELFALFWHEERADAHWHGFPLYPIRSDRAVKQVRKSIGPPQQVFNLFVDRGLMTASQARRLKKGAHVREIGGTRT